MSTYARNMYRHEINSLQNLVPQLVLVFSFLDNIPFILRTSSSGSDVRDLAAAHLFLPSSYYLSHNVICLSCSFIYFLWGDVKETRNESVYEIPGLWDLDDGGGGVWNWVF